MTPSFTDELRRRFGDDRIACEPEQLVVFECDGHTLSRGLPDAVVYPETTEEVATAVRIANRYGVPFLARGAGTGLSGGAVAAHGGLIIETARMNRILELDYDNRIAIVQPGLVNLHLSNATRDAGFHYAPDPSSQGACTIGGNVAENSGGPHTLKYGVTTNHVLALTIVLPDGNIITTGTAMGDAPGLDLTGVFVGSEGTFGIATEVTVRLTPVPEGVRTFLAIYDAIAPASETVSAVIRAGIVPAAMELIDALTIEAVETHMKLGYPTDAAAVLLIEIDGIESELDAAAEEVERICAEHGARRVERATDEAARTRLWKGRKLSLGAMGKIARAFYTHDGVVPRSRLPEALAKIAEIGTSYGVRIANVCHAGDGNLHPLVLFDPDDAAERERAHDAGVEILTMCIELGGALTGEHGIGLEKAGLIDRLFTEADLDQMARVRAVFDPAGRANPGKIFPTGAACGEMIAARAERTGGWI